jgi:hypothetical protein
MVAPDELEAATAIGWRHPAAVESIGRPTGRCDSGTVVIKDRVDVAEELGDEDGGWPCASAPSIH